MAVSASASHVDGSASSGARSDRGTKGPRSARRRSQKCRRGRQMRVSRSREAAHSSPEMVQAAATRKGGRMAALGVFR